MKSILVFLVLILGSSFASAKTASSQSITLVCTGTKVWVRVWEQQNSLRTEQYLMATANYLGEASSSMGNLFGPEVLNDKNNQNIKSLPEFKKIKVGVGFEPWYKKFTLDLKNMTFTYEKGGQTVLMDKLVKCQIM